MAATSGYSAYRNVPIPSGNPLAETFLRSADQIDRVLTGGMPGNEAQAVVDKLRDFWTMLQVAIASPETQTGPQLRANIISLSLYADRVLVGMDVSREISDADRKGLRSLTDIHRNLAIGFQSMPLPANTPAQPEAIPSHL